MIGPSDIFKASILIVDDHDADILLLTRTLANAGYTAVTSTMNPLEVCELYRTHRHNLILLDIEMPVMDGFQVMEGLKEIETDGYLPVLVMTVQPDHKLRALRAGAKDFISKPFDLAEVSARVYNMLEVRMLQAETKNYSKVLEETVQELEASREVIRLRIAEEALRDSEERYRQLFEGNPIPTYVLDQETQRFLAFNEAAVQEYGYSREELLSLTSKDICSPDEFAAFVESLSELPDGPPRGTTWKHQKKDGTTIAVETTFRPLVFAGRPAWVVHANNVTDREILEEQQRQLLKMNALGQLAGGVAHDFNNLLTVINGYSELVMGRLQAADPLQKYVEHIKQAGEHAVALTRQLLAFSRKQVLMPNILDLNAVLSELQKMLPRLISEDIALRADLGGEVGNIKADRGQIEQIVINLVVNARDAMPSGGKLTIETQNVDLTEDYTRQHADVNPGPYVMLAVTDTGVGMDARTQSRIFEPFFTTKEAGKGTGLGLSTVYGIVQQSGGSIWVYSEVGRGTTFKIYLPRASGDPRLYQQSRAPEGAARGTETILLVEDDDMVRALAKEVLSTHGYQVLEAANGDAALLISERHAESIHLLITDIVLPGMSGPELVDRLAALRPGIRTLYMSGYTDRAIVHQQVLDEQMSFIQKPFAPQEFVNKVREVIDKSS